MVKLDVVMKGLPIMLDVSTELFLISYLLLNGRIVPFLLHSIVETGAAEETHCKKPCLVWSTVTLLGDEMKVGITIKQRNSQMR